MKRVLIAHQSTIPHYRVDFYNALQSASHDWSFEVAFDPSEPGEQRFFREEVDPARFGFSLRPTRTWALRLGEKVFNFQSFFFAAWRYDLIVVGSCLSNLTYPSCLLYRLLGRRVVVWGHGRDRTVARPSSFKRALERFRSSVARSADGFLAYTPDIRVYLAGRGVASEKIRVLNNTIDIVAERARYERHRLRRDAIRAGLGLAPDDRVWLFVGRFTRNKRIDFLLDAFALHHARDPRHRLLLVGDGAESRPLPKGALGFGPTVGDALAPFYAAADVFAFPGDVGLGPLQALCHDLPVVTLESPTHMPEFVYLSASNALVLPQATSPADYAAALAGLVDAAGCLAALRATIWSSIEHLTVENMAKNFIAGIDAALAR